MNTDNNQKIKQDLKKAMEDSDKIKGPKKEKVRKDIQGVSVDLYQAQADRKKEKEKREQQVKKEEIQREAENKYYANGKIIRNLGYTAVVILIIVFSIIWLVNS